VDGNKPVKQKYTMFHLTSHSFSQWKKLLSAVSFPDPSSSATSGCPLAVQWPPAWYHQLTEESQCSLTFPWKIHQPPVAATRRWDFSTKKNFVKSVV